MRYASTRIARFILVFVIVTFLVMFATRIGSKDPVRDLAGGQVGPAVIEKVEQDFPYVRRCEGILAYAPCLGSQYAHWLGDVVTGNMGYSYAQNQSVVDMFRQRGPSTVWLGVWAIVIGLVIAVPVGVYSAYRRDGALDRRGADARGQSSSPLGALWRLPCRGWTLCAGRADASVFRESRCRHRTPGVGERRAFPHRQRAPRA